MEQKTKSWLGNWFKCWIERKEKYPLIRRYIHNSGDTEKAHKIHELFNEAASAEGFAPATVLLILGAALGVAAMWSVYHALTAEIPV